MRIRRKKHIDERLKAVSDIVLFSDLDIMNVNLAVKEKKYLDLRSIFGNDNPVELEIGCGKGGFIVEKARLHPNTNYLAVELLSNIIVMAGENAKRAGLSNVRFFNSGADYLPRYIKDGSISAVHLNFSPPFPGDRYKNRRLTCDRLVQNYRNFLSEDGVIYQKTDDREFFEFSYSQFEKFGFTVNEVSDLVYENKIENVLTEYEKKFIEKGVKINYLIAKK